MRFRTAGVLRSCLLLCTLFFCLHVSAQTVLQQRLDKLIENTSFLQTSEVGIYVYDLTHDRPLYDYQAGKLYRPASIQKLITSVSALSMLQGADTLFCTSLCHTGQIKNGVLKGDLYVIGGFDPEFDEKSMQTLAGMVDSLGIRKIEGRLYGDLSMTDSLYWGPGWSWDDTPYAFQPYLSPLMYNKGCVEVTAIPGAKGSAASLSFSPVSSFYTVTNRTVSHSPAAGKFVFGRNWLEGGNALTVKGNVDHKRTDRVNIYTSQDFFMHVFSERLNRHGIATEAYAWRKCPVGDSVRRIGAVSHSLREALRPALKKSDNLSAEAVFRKLSLLFPREERTSSENGAYAVQKMISLLGMDPKEYKIVDGSGVSLYNYVSPRLIVAFLKHAYVHKAIFSPLYESLPVAGVDGTLCHRMKQGKAYKNVHAKTGSVTGISSLAGFVKMEGGEYVAFCIINQNVLDLRKARAFQDQVCRILAGE